LHHSSQASKGLLGPVSRVIKKKKKKKKTKKKKKKN